jgi:hypothetical protein
MPCELLPVRKRDSARLSELPALIRVEERLARGPVQLAPTCRPPPVDGEQLWVAATQLGAEQIAEQMVVAVPLPAIIDRDDERV